MTAASRRKGVRGEREVAAAFEAAGWTVRGLEGGGDHFAAKMHERYYDLEDTYGPDNVPVNLHVEAKRHERLRIPEWLAQAAAEAPPGVPPLVCFRQSRGQWYAVLALDDLLELIG